MYCPYCKTETESVVRVVRETYPVKGEDTTINAHVRFCIRCGKDVWDNELDSKNLLDSYAVYEKKHQSPFK